MTLDQLARQARRQYMTQTNEVCPMHNKRLVVIKTPLHNDPYKVCPICHQENLEKENEILVSEKVKKLKRDKQLYFLNKFSLLDEELKNASFGNFQTLTKQQREDLENVKALARGYLKNGNYNLVLIGDTGVGKSHLARSILKAISDNTDQTVAFINVIDLFSKLKRDFDSTDYYIEKMAEVDLLVLDDVGSEKISDWATSILQSLFDKRKKTIITTNLEPEELLDVYGSRVHSRIFKGTGLGTTNEHVYRFHNTADQRMKL